MGINRYIIFDFVQNNGQTNLDFVQTNNKTNLDFVQNSS